MVVGLRRHHHGVTSRKGGRMSDETHKGNVVKIPVKFKHRLFDETFLLIKKTGCLQHGPFTVDAELADVICDKCGEKMNPIQVLLIMARNETKWHEAGKRYGEEMKRLRERSRTKCRHCGKITPITDR